MDMFIFVPRSMLKLCSLSQSILAANLVNRKEKDGRCVDGACQSRLECRTSLGEDPDKPPGPMAAGVIGIMCCCSQSTCGIWGHRRSQSVDGSRCHHMAIVGCGIIGHLTIIRKLWVYRRTTGAVGMCHRQGIPCWKVAPLSQRVMWLMTILLEDLSGQSWSDVDCWP